MTLIDRIAAVLLEHRDADVRDLARLVLREMREPTPGMMDAVPERQSAVAVWCWQAMIAAACA